MFAIERPSYKEVVDHIDHVVKLVGVNHVGIGSDFDGIEVTPEGLEGVDKLPVITKELKLRGYSENDIKLILGGNFMRLL
jgi:membrane dipeptidase